MRDICTGEGKEIFDTKQDAESAIKERGWTGKSRVYQCRKCYAFHITSAQKCKGKSPAMLAMETAVAKGWAKVIDRISNDKTERIYSFNGKEYRFIYSKRTKSIKVLAVRKLYKSKLEYE